MDNIILRASQLSVSTLSASVPRTMVQLDLEWMQPSSDWTCFAEISLKVIRALYQLEMYHHTSAQEKNKLFELAGCKELNRD